MLTALSKIRLLWTLCLSLITILCPLFSEVRDFQVFEVEKDGTCTKYLPQTVKGTERMNLGLNRLSMLSEDQIGQIQHEKLNDPISPNFTPMV